ncbi:hypothetical protein [Klebsiella pneumoniae IS10]|nr:hypothetical protein [Klebsiella pneumoniae IS10]
MRRVFNETAQQLRVVFVVAALQGFLIEQLLTVFDTFHALEAGFRGVHPGGSLMVFPPMVGIFSTISTLAPSSWA